MAKMCWRIPNVTDEKQIEQKQHKNHLSLKNRRNKHQRQGKLESIVSNRENKEHHLSCGWDENGPVVMQQPNNLLGE